MPYTEKKIRKFIPLTDLNFSAGTWAYTIASNIHSQNKSAADTTTVMSIPITMPSGRDFYGAKLEGFSVVAEVSTADLDAVPSATLQRQDYDAVDTTASATSLVAKTSIDITAGAGCVVTADAQQRLWSWTVDSPAADYDTEQAAQYIAEVTINAGASSVVKIFGAYADFIVLV